MPQPATTKRIIRRERIPGKTRCVSLRSGVTIDEKAQVQQYADLAGLSVGAYIRRRSLQKPVPAVGIDEGEDSTDGEGLAPTRKQLARLILEINQLTLQIKGVGNNVNQLARNKHTGREERLAWQGVAAEIKHRLAQAEKALDQALEAGF